MEWLPSIASGATLTPLGGSGVSPLQAVEKLTVRAGFIPPHTMCNPLLPEDSDEEKQEKQT